MEINYELKALRAKNNIRQRNMADMLHITVATYNRKENGARSFTIDEAKEVAEFFNTSIEKIFFSESVVTK